MRVCWACLGPMSMKKGMWVAAKVIAEVGRKEREREQKAEPGELVVCELEST